MNSIYRIITLVSLLTLFSSGLYSAETDSLHRSPEENHRNAVLNQVHIVNLSKDTEHNPDSIRTLIGSFYLNQFRHAQDPEIPYFMFLSKSGDMTMGIGGVVKMRGWYDWNGAIPVNGFSPYLIPTPKNPTQMRKLSATPAGTAIFLTILARNTRLGNIQGYIEGNFNGYNHVGFKLSRAYVTVNDWTVGYAKSTFNDPASTPQMIDGAGPNGQTNRTNILVRYMHTMKKNWVVAGSLEFPNIQVSDYAQETKACTPYLPDVAAFAQYQWDEGISHVRVSGLLRSLPYRDLINNKNHNILGWGALLSGVVKVAHPLKVYAQCNFGRGNGSYLTDLAIDNIDLVPEPEKPGKLYAPHALGATIGLQYYITPDLYVNAMAAEMRYFSKSGVSPQMYKYGSMAAVNCFWYITPRISTGIEYLFGRKKNVGGTHGSADRVTAFFQLSF